MCLLKEEKNFDMQSLSTTVSADDGWQGDLGSDRRSLRCTFTRLLIFFFQRPWIMQNNYVGKLPLDSVMIFASREYVLQMQEKQTRDKVMLIFSVWDSLNGHKGD